jgi:hypothetical protein
MKVTGDGWDDLWRTLLFGQVWTLIELGFCSRLQGERDLLEPEFPVWNSVYQCIVTQNLSRLKFPAPSLTNFMA